MHKTNDLASELIILNENLTMQLLFAIYTFLEPKQISFKIWIDQKHYVPSRPIQ